MGHPTVSKTYSCEQAPPNAELAQMPPHEEKIEEHGRENPLNARDLSRWRGLFAAGTSEARSATPRLWIC